MKHRHVISYALFATLTIFAWQKPIFAEPPNLSQLLLEVKTYHDSGGYDQDLCVIIKAADDFIVRRAQANNQHAKPKKLAIVLDIDETSLSNYKRMEARNFTGSKHQWKKDVFAADAPAIKPMLILYKDAIAHNVSVFFVTGRHESERVPTSQNLAAAGYQGWSAIYLKPDDYKENSAIPFKLHARESIEKQGYIIIASIGDQNSDLAGGHAEKTFKLPNPYYYIP
jgi:predicted secreted acid phosphatase